MSTPIRIHGDKCCAALLGRAERTPLEEIRGANVSALTPDDKCRLIWEERAITRLMLDFGRTLDTGDWVAHRACLADTISMDFQRLTGVPATRVAADDWVTFADAILSPTRRHHTYSNFKVDMNGAQAFAVVYQTSRHWRATDLGASEYNQYGWCHAWFRQYSGEWKIVRLKHDFSWVGGNNGLFDMRNPTLIAAMTKVFSADNLAAAAAHSWL